MDGFHSVGRAAGSDDLSAVAACLTSAFYDDPVWGSWTFPDESSRTERLYELMHFWAQAAVRHPWVRMTENAETVAVWLPPGEPEMTPNEETAFGQLLISLIGARAQEVQALLNRFDEHHPKEPHYYLSLWATHRDHAGRGLGRHSFMIASPGSMRSGCPPTLSPPTQRTSGGMKHSASATWRSSIPRVDRSSERCGGMSFERSIVSCWTFLPSASASRAFFCHTARLGRARGIEQGAGLIVRDALSGEKRLKNEGRVEDAKGSAKDTVDKVAATLAIRNRNKM